MSRRNAVHHHLMQVGPMVFGDTVLTEAFAAAAGEHQRGGVEQHDREVGEQITPAFEQRFLDQILGPPGSLVAPPWSASASPSQAMAR